MERLEELMATRKRRAHSLRTNVAHDRLIEYQGKVMIAKVCSASLTNGIKSLSCMTLSKNAHPNCGKVKLESS